MARKRRRRGRRRGSLGPLMPFLSIVLAAVAIVAALTLFFKIGKYEVTGNSRYSREEILAAADVPEGSNLVLLNRFEVAQRIYTKLPYITEVRVNQKPPDLLQLEVTETKAVAAVRGGGVWWLMSAGGKLLETVEEAATQPYLVLRGIEALEPALGNWLQLDENSTLSLERLLSLMEELEKQGCLKRANYVDASNSRQLVMGYDGRFEVEIPYDADFAFKLLCLSKTVDENLEPNETGVIRMTNDLETRFIPYEDMQYAANSDEGEEGEEGEEEKKKE